jgi:hypothetical protein
MPFPQLATSDQSQGVESKCRSTSMFHINIHGFLYMFPLNHHKSTQWKNHPAYLTRISLNMCLIYFPSHPDLPLGCLFLLIIHLTTNYINPWITSRNSQQDRIVFPGWYRWHIASSFLTFLSFSGLLYYIKNHFSSNQPTDQPTNPPTNRPTNPSRRPIMHMNCALPMRLGFLRLAE